MKKVATLFALALAAVALVSCGGDDDGDTETAGGDSPKSTLIFEADPSGALAYRRADTSAKAGKVKIVLENLQGGSAHDVVIEDSKGKTVGRTYLVLDSTTSTTVNLKPGSYTFYCSIAGHRQAGMEGELTVE